MEHLKAAFHEELAAPDTENERATEGVIHIREKNWSAHEVLQAMGEPVYEEVFQNWREERRDFLLGKADETLVLFDQSDRFELLKQSFSNGMVMPFVGAGMSMSSGYLGWTAFLRRLRAELGLNEGEFEALLTAGQYEDAAQVIANALGAGFNERVEAKYAVDKELRGPVQFLPHVFPTATVLTTNFDDVVRRCYAARGAAFGEEIQGLNAEELPRHLAAGRRILVRLHGISTSGRNRVLTANEYNAAYADPDVLPRVIRAACARTMLFLGCSLTVDRILGALRSYVEAEGHDRVARHYAFLPAPEDPEQRRTKERTLERLNIYPIWYPANEDDGSIEGFFYRLADGVIDL